MIRFDAAMVLARKHVERLWWPLPGAGDGIPSRAEHAMRKAEFDRLMPTEFWRDVVDRVAAEVPNTLLLAEAFWLLEGYFVRTLGMHRVYNSAFMHMLRDEDNAGYRRVIRETLEFDPEILKRYVNFMSNPDEETALEQFGSGDKYLGVATMLMTLPGLPMLGHGQVEGFTEKYGMEFRRARLDERPDEDLVGRHERHLFPLVHRRAMFAEARDFLLFDFVRDDGAVDEHVYAYSNGAGDDRSLIVYHNRFAETTGTIRMSVPFAVKGPDGSKTQARRSLADGLGVAAASTGLIGFRDERAGLEYLLPAARLRDGGLRLHLDAYRCYVLTGFRELHDSAGRPWSRLAAEIGDRGVPSLDEAMRDLELAPLHETLRAAVVDPARLPELLDAVAATGAPRIRARRPAGARAGLVGQTRHRNARRRSRRPGSWPTQPGAEPRSIDSASTPEMRPSLRPGSSSSRSVPPSGRPSSAISGSRLRSRTRWPAVHGLDRGGDSWHGLRGRRAGRCVRRAGRHPAPARGVGPRSRPAGPPRRARVGRGRMDRRTGDRLADRPGRPGPGRRWCDGPRGGRGGDPAPSCRGRCRLPGRGARREPGPQDEASVAGDESGRQEHLAVRLSRPRRGRRPS